MFKSKLTMTICCVAAMIPLAFYFYLYPQMPDFVPIHYDGATADRFVNKSSFQVILLSGFGWIGFLIMRLLHLFLRKVFLSSYIENVAAVNRIWNAATIVVTIVFAVISTYALTAMV
jgi:hypothetical protein